jgi:hypothetical protein
MDAADFARDIRRSEKFFRERIDIIRTVSALSSLNVNPDFNTVALDETRSYEDIYTAAVSLSYFNFMLTDFSIFQFSWSNDDAWRLAYLPNPWIAGVREAGEAVSSWELLQEQGELSQ